MAGAASNYPKIGLVAVCAGHDPRFRPVARPRWLPTSAANLGQLASPSMLLLLCGQPRYRFGLLSRDPQRR